MPEPASPSTSSRRAQRTLLAMIFAEIDMADRIHDSVPVEPGMRACSASRWLWIVTMGLEWSRVSSESAGMVGSCDDAMLEPKV